MAKVRCWLCLGALAGAVGCSMLPTRADLQEAGLIPSRTKPWCLPRVKHERDTKTTVVGVRCAW